MSTRRKVIVAFVLSSIFGAVVWAISPTITGYAEPWDSSTAYYPLALFLGGIALGLLQPGTSSIHYLGALLGQLCFMIVATGAGPFIILGVIFLGAYTILLLIGTIAGSKVRTEYLEVRFRSGDGA